MPELMPAIFFGHGNPMNAVLTNAYTESWRRIGAQTRKPKAILAIPGHLYVPGTGGTISTSPRTIHDFSGFPPELFRVQYPAPGDPHLARRVQQLLAPLPVTLDNNWGLDHGTWSVLVHAYPKADIPVVQLSINESQPASFHFDIGKKLAPVISSLSSSMKSSARRRCSPFQHRITTCRCSMWSQPSNRVKASPSLSKASMVDRSS